MVAKKKFPKPPKNAVNVNYTYAQTHPQEIIENKNEIVIDLNGGYIKVYSTTESLAKVIKTADQFARKMTGPDLRRYVT